MKRLYNVAIMVVVALAATIAVSCSNESDAVLTKQQNDISRYLTSSHQPKLVEESEVSAQPNPDPHFYTHWGLNIFRYIATYYDEGREDEPEVTGKSTIEIIYSAYIFTGSKPAASALYATNDETQIAELKNLGLNTEYEWTTEPLRVRMGKDELLDGLETALKGCRKGDSVEVYLTYDKAYGKHYVGSVPAKSSVVWYIDIVEVE